MFGRKKGIVFVGISGGVDSSVSAALLKEAGYDVTGVFIRIALPGYPCTAGEDRRDALRAATHLDIPFIDIDLSEAYRESVFKPALAEFARGRTPNPDALCNREIKFGLFYEFARAQGADFVATGHYAQSRAVGGEQHLHAGADEQKDQSYFLWTLSENELRHTLFPVGHLKKPQVREIADRLKLPNATRKDSQGLCFLGDIGIEDMLQKELPQQEGAVLDESGAVIGTHRGATLYTLGQRHGFSINATSSTSRPYFVVAKSVAQNTVTVSQNQTPNAHSTSMTLIETNWIGAVQDGPCVARFRYRAALIPAVLTRTDGETRVTLSGAHLIPEGQSLVLYQSNEPQSRCFGGGVIDTVSLEK